jgi:hypothetical protein
MPAASRRAFQLRPLLEHVAGLEPRLGEELAEADIVALARQLAQFLDLAIPAVRYAVADAPQHDVARDAIELHVASGGQEGKAAAHLGLERRARAIQQRREFSIEAELPAMQADEVEDCADALAGGPAQAAPQLLQEQRRAVRGAQHQQRVHARHVDAFVEQIDRENRVDPCLGERA